MNKPDKITDTINEMAALQASFDRDMAKLKLNLERNKAAQDEVTFRLKQMSNDRIRSPFFFEG